MALASLLVLGACTGARCVPTRDRRAARRGPVSAPLLTPVPPAAPAPPLPAPATSPSASQMVMEANGWRLPVTHAVATTHGGEALTVWLSNAPLSCESARRDSFGSQAGQELLRLRLARPLTRARGDTRAPLDAWSVRSVHAFRSLASDSLGAPTPTATISEGLAVEGRSGHLQLDYDSGDPPIHVHGTTTVTGCGIAQVTRVAPRPQARMSIAIGDTTLPVVGATLKSWGLHLSTAPLDCGPVIPDRDVDVRVMLGPGVRPRHVFVDGDRMPPLPHALDAEPLSISPVGPPDPTAPIATLAIRGTLGADLERPIRLSGVVEALRCP